MSNPYPERFAQLLAETDGPVLDCGSGGRSHPRVASLEPAWHPDNSVQGDGMNLPFRDDTFALILSQAVIEHVCDPQRMVDEMFRVLRPGGAIWAEVAFMQPVHQPPLHFFNVTPFGLAYLFRAWKIVEQGAFGKLVDWWRWVGGEAGAHEVLSERERASVEAAMRKLDAAITPTQLHNIASGVCVLARKP